MPRWRNGVYFAGKMRVFLRGALPGIQSKGGAWRLTFFFFVAYFQLLLKSSSFFGPADETGFCYRPKTIYKRTLSNFFRKIGKRWLSRQKKTFSRNAEKPFRGRLPIF